MSIAPSSVTTAKTPFFDKKIGIAIILGNTIAWGDFALYAYFSPVLAHVFFPFTSQANAYILYFVVFALGFLFRPFGAALAGTFADTHGRKNTLLATVCISSILTALIGCLPSYDTIGFFSPLLLTVLRILQTMSVSAEPTNSGSLLIEHAPHHRKGLVSSCVMIGIFLGFLLGILSFLLITDYLTEAEIVNWGWRVPFLSNVVIGSLVALFLITAHESPIFLAKKAQGLLPKAPFKTAFTSHKMAMFVSFGYSLMMAVTNYFLLGFIPNFLNQDMGLNLKLSNLYITISLVITVILIPLMGMWSDKIGRRPILAGGALGYIIFGYPILWLMSSGKPL